MADNYLERKMEEYRQAKPKVVHRRTPNGNRPETAVLPIRLKAAFVVGNESLSPILTSCAIALRNTSCHTVFCCTDQRCGAATAQANGLRYFPISKYDACEIDAAIALAKADYGHIDVILSQNGSVLSIDVEDLHSEVSPAQDCPQERFVKHATMLVIYLSLPQSIELGVCGRFKIKADGSLSIVKD